MMAEQLHLVYEQTVLVRGVLFFDTGVADTDGSLGLLNAAAGLTSTLINIYIARSRN